MQGVGFIMKRKYILAIFLLILFVFSFEISSDEFFIYNVKSGDTLSTIANNFRVNLKKLIELNSIRDSNYIITGQNLKIPLSFNTYIVKEGDSLGKLAKMFNTNIQKLLNSNKIEHPDKIYIGQKIIIPENTERTRYTLASRTRHNNYIWPVQGKISSEYGWRIHPVYKTREFHTGLDIAAPFGTPVYAAKNGIVQFSGWSDGYGKLIKIKHQDNSITFYGHNLDLLVNEGEEVKQGKVIALVGATGIATGPHLHFEIRINNQHVNPLEYLNNSYMNNGFRI